MIWSLEYGVWSLDTEGISGVWLLTLDSGRWALDSGVWTVTLDSGETILRI